jgi:hypothetical protein
MAEPNASKESALSHLLSVVHDPQAEAKRRDSAAVAIASLYTPLPAAATSGKSGSNATPVIADALTEDVLRGLAEALVPFIKELITEAVAECMKDGGAWKKEVLYQPNQVVTSDGTLWICRQPNSNAKPPGDCWRQLHRTIGRR